MIRDDAHRLLVIAVPKTGSTATHEALERALSRRMPHGQEWDYHATALEVRTSVGEETWSRYTTAAFVRDPWSRFVSGYKHYTSGEVESFASFCRAFEAGDFAERIHFRPQVHFVCDEEGALMVDELGRYETLEADLHSLGRRVGLDIPSMRWLGVTSRLPYLSEVRHLPLKATVKNVLRYARARIQDRLRPRVASETWRAYYREPDARDLVRRVYADDFETLGYDDADPR